MAFSTYILCKKYKTSLKNKEHTRLANIRYVSCPQMLTIQTVYTNVSVSNTRRFYPILQTLLAKLLRISVDFCWMLAVRLFIHGEFTFNLWFNWNGHVFAQRRLNQSQYHGVWLRFRCFEHRPGHIYTGFPLHAERQGEQS